MEIIIRMDKEWYLNDFIASLGSLIKETAIDKKIILVIERDTREEVIRYIKRNLDEEKFIKFESIENAKKIINEDLILLIRLPLMFYSNWMNQMMKAYVRFGKKYNYVPSFVNHRGDQISILSKVYPEDLLFDLDYKRDPMKRSNINYFNDVCALQYKKIKNPDHWIILHTNEDMGKKQTICVLSCAVAKLKR